MKTAATRLIILLAILGAIWGIGSLIESGSRWVDDSEDLSRLPNVPKIQIDPSLTPRESLERLKVRYSTSEFVKYAGSADPESTKILELFLAAGIDPDAEDFEGQTALLMALGRGLTKNVRLLLENGASVDKPTRYDPLYAALGSSEEKTLLILKYGADIPGDSNDGSTFLMQMAAAGHANVIRVLLDRSMDPNEEDQSGNTALMLASQAGRKEAVTLLLNHGAAVNARNYNDETALIMAAKRGWGAVAEILLDHGADVDLKDSSGETALIHAVRQLATDPYCISILLEKGADPNTRNNRGETPLHLIVNKVKDPLSDYYNKIWIKTAQMLISNGADVRAENNFGVTPMKIANRNNVRAMIEFLEENGAGRFE